MSSKKNAPSNDGMKMPSVFSMAKNFAKDLSKYIKEGAPNVSNKQYVKRMSNNMSTLCHMFTV